MVTVLSWILFIPLVLLFGVFVLLLFARKGAKLEMEREGRNYFYGIVFFAGITLLLGIYDLAQGLLFIGSFLSGLGAIFLGLLITRVKVAENKARAVSTLSSKSKAVSEKKQGISRCRYFMCSKCSAIYEKEAVLSGWRTALFFAGSSQMIFGSRTCKCGNVMQVDDIYKGVHDLPLRYWGQVQGPVEVD